MFAKGIPSLLLGLAFTTLMIQQVAAQQPQLVSHSDLVRRLDELEAEVARVRATSSSANQYAGNDAVGVDPGCPCDVAYSSCSHGGCSGYCHCNAGWYVGAEAVFVSAFFEDGNEPDEDEPSFGINVSPRVWLGMRNNAGFGIRGRYWWADMDSEVVAGEQTNLEFQVADLEATRSVCWGPVEAEFFGGVRYAQLSHAFVQGGSPAEIFGASTRGIGPSVGVDTLTPLGCGNLDLVGNLRAAWLFGEVSGLDTDRVDKAFFPMEVQLGLRYSRCIGSGVLSLHALAESQYWMASLENSSDLSNNNQDDDFALFGFTIGGQYRF